MARISCRTGFVPSQNDFHERAWDYRFQLEPYVGQVVTGTGVVRDLRFLKDGITLVCLYGFRLTGTNRRAAAIDHIWVDVSNSAVREVDLEFGDTISLAGEVYEYATERGRNLGLKGRSVRNVTKGRPGKGRKAKERHHQGKLSLAACL